ncbi:hypothetical protein Taro_027245, partial [Colocasia esculenta]|nr:hypothetical protein [Colocasia esculenta]
FRLRVDLTFYERDANLGQTSRHCADFGRGGYPSNLLLPSSHPLPVSSAMEALCLSTLLPRLPPDTIRTSFFSRLRRPSPPLLPILPRRTRANSRLPSVSPAAVSAPLVDLDDRSVSAKEKVGVDEGGEREGAEEFDWRAQWYPVAPVCDLDKRVPHAKRVLGLDLVVWWDKAAERWQVFEDSCPHRLAPLSEGRIDQWGRLQCVYHGWCFDAAGSCKYIPQAPADGPPVHTFKRACANVYPSFEQNKIVWFWPNSDPQFKDTAMKKKPPYIPELDDPSYTCTMGMRDLQYGYEVLIENLMDPAHVHYAHYGIMRLPKKPTSVTSVDREGGVPLDIMVPKIDISGFIAKQDNGYGTFIAPCLFYLSRDLTSNRGSDLSKVTKEESFASSQQKMKRVLLVFICIPVSPGRSRLIWVFPRNFAVWIDRIVPRWMFHVGQNLILDSDLYLLHIEEHKIASIGTSNWQKACFLPTKSDAMVVAFRKWLRKYSNNKVDWGTNLKSELPSTPPRQQLMDRYWTHSVQCSSCRGALKGLQVLEVSLQIISVALIGTVAAIKQNSMSTVTRSAIISVSILAFVASRWLSHFIYKNFYYHDYNHALR